MKWRERCGAHVAVMVYLVLLCVACERRQDMPDVNTAAARSEEHAGRSAAARAAAGVQTSSANEHERVPAEITAYAQALAGAGGSATNILAAQLRRSATFVEKRRATTAMVNSLSSSGECVACVMRLLEHAGTPRERAVAQRDLGYVFLRFKDYNASTCAFARMLRETSADGDDDADLRYGAHVGLAMAEAHAGNYAAQLRHAQEALMEAGKTGNRRCLDAARDEMAMALINTKQFDAALEYLNQRLRDEPGNEFVKMLKEDAEKRRSPIILHF